MGRQVIYASSVSRRQVRLRRARRRGSLLAPRLAMLAMWGAAAAFTVAVIAHLT